MKDLPYFQFFNADWLGGNIQGCPPEVRGIYTDIMALYWRNDCKLDIETIEDMVRSEKQCLSNALDKLKQKGIIAINEDGFISIKFLDKQYSERIEAHEKRVNAGRKGGSVKGYKKSLSNAKAKLLNISDSNSNSISLSPEGGTGETIINMSDNKLSLKNQIDDIYLSYPKQSQEIKAKRAIATVITKGEINPVELMNHVRRYSMAISWKDPAYIPDCHTWIENQRWTDDPATWEQPKDQKPENEDEENAKMLAELRAEGRI